jgi:internalin A
MRNVIIKGAVLLGLLSMSNISTIHAQQKPLTEAEVEKLKTYNSIEEAMNNPKEVEAFFMNYAKLNEVPAEVAQFTNVIVLGFGANNIKEIPEFICNLENLQALGFSHNQISNIPDDIARLTNLTSFRCWNNLLTRVPNALLNLPNIQVIELKGNPIPKDEKSRLKKSYPNIKFLF